ncbi:hypothetical protein LEMLEM_LOCUS7028, partial [Lemmus lemmus]
ACSLGFLSHPVPHSRQAPKKNHTDISIRLSADWPLSAGFLMRSNNVYQLIILVYISRMAHTFLSWAGYMLTP